MVLNQVMRHEFDLDPDLIYLNSGTHSIVPRRVLDAVQRHQRHFERNPTANLFGVAERLWATQKGLAGFLGVRAEDLFLRANITEPIAEFILGVPLAEGEILTSDLEYGAIANICRFRAEQDSRP